MKTGQNSIEKIAQKFAVGLAPGSVVHSGDYISIRPLHVMTHDNTSAVMSKFLEAIGAKEIADPRQPVFTLDHDIQNRDRKNLDKYEKIENFAHQMGVDFYPAGRGIGHQVMCEEGYAWPGSMVVASDSHSNIYGGLGCLGTPVVRTDAAAIWATGRTWWSVPPVARVELCGKLRPGVTGKDVIITLCGLFNKDQVLNHAIEFTGDDIAALSIDYRLSIANMTTEWGALAGVFPVDNRTISWLSDRTKKEHPRLGPLQISKLKAQFENGELESDKDASYAKELTLSLESVTPHVSGPHHVKVMHSVTELEKENVKIDKAYLVSCVNSRVEDLAEAAAVVRGKEVSKGVEFYIAAASSEVQKESERRGDWQGLLSAGAIPLPPGCGPCIGKGAGLLKDGEVGISATNRNFKGRMGSREARAYLASPAVVAASALAGKIASPVKFDDIVPKGAVKETPVTTVKREVSILEGFPEFIEGELLFCHQDNMNTDGIYPGKYTYMDNLSPEDMAKVVMENYDTEFSKIATEGDILIGGYNFGTGSSREQAATALKYRGIALVIAGSFSETYKRNAINNGFLVIEAPQLVDELKRKFDDDTLTMRTKIVARVDFRRALIVADDKEYATTPLGTAAQELILTGGLEAWVKKQIRSCL